MTATPIGIRIFNLQGVGAQEAYFTLSDHPPVGKVEISEGVSLDVDAQGATIGILLSLPAKVVPYARLISKHGVSVTTAALMKALVPHLGALTDDMDISLTNENITSPKP